MRERIAKGEHRVSACNTKPRIWWSERRPDGERINHISLGGCETRPVLTFKSHRRRARERDDLNFSFNYHSELECNEKIYGGSQRFARLFDYCVFGFHQHFTLSRHWSLKWLKKPMEIKAIRSFLEMWLQVLNSAPLWNPMCQKCWCFEALASMVLRRWIFLKKTRNYGVKKQRETNLLLPTDSWEIVFRFYKVLQLARRCFGDSFRIRFPGWWES